LMSLLFVFTLFIFTPFVLSGCGEEKVTEAETQNDFGSLPSDSSLVEPQSIGAYTSIAWPFGSSQHPNNWSGVKNERTDGGMIDACGGRINSHTGADYYARDLYCTNGPTAGKDVFAGFSGLVVKANWSDCYGNCVVIYDHSRRVAVRYAHLQSIAVTENQWVNIRQYIGKVGNTGCGSFNPHLHLVVYENINHFITRHGNPNWPVVPIVCDSDFYACQVYFFS